MSAPGPGLDHLRLRSLILLETLARTGSLHQAARAMHVSQPALSVLLQELERTLGGRLFERSRRGLTLTTMGGEALHQATIVTADLRRLQVEFAARQNGMTLVRVGVLPLMMLDIVPRALERLRRTTPALRIEFREGAAADLLRGVRDGALDVVLGRLIAEFAADPDLAHTVLFADRYCVISGRQHPLARRRRVSWKTLRDADWIQSPPNTVLREHFADAFVRQGLTPPRPLYESASFYSCVGILATSSCLMLVPREVGRHFSRTRAVTILGVSVGDAPAAFSLIRRRSRAETSGVRAFAEAVQAATRSRRGRGRR
jgi:DNA-binding transcriptional LysR family regulator